MIRASIRRPIAIAMIYAAILIIGIVSLLALPVELMPNTSFGQISVLVQVRGGMPPTEVETLVSRPIEEALSTVSHLKNVISISKEGDSTVVLNFEPGIDMDYAALEVREKFAKVKHRLPREIERPVIAKYESNDVPILIIAVMSEVYSPEELRRMVEEKVKGALRRITGVANVEIGGGRERKILVEIDQDRLRALGLPIERVIGSLALNNLNLEAGEVEEARHKFLVRTIGAFESIEDIKNIGVALAPQGSIIRLKEIAQVKDAYLEPTSFARVNVSPVVTLYLQKESTANTVRVVREVLAELDRIRPTLGPHVDLVTTSNQAEFIQQAIRRVSSALLEGAILSILILLIFLSRTMTIAQWSVRLLGAFVLLSIFSARQWLPHQVSTAVTLFALVLFPWACVRWAELRPTFVIALAIPISVIAAFALLFLQKVTLNIMTLSGLALGVGKLVDDAIVVLDQTEKKVRAGLGAAEAAAEGTQEVCLAIIAGTLTSVVVFLPIVFVNPSIRLLYWPLALTVTYALLASLLVALTLVPSLSARLHVASTSAVDERVVRPWLHQWMRWYRRWAPRALRHRYRVVGAAGALFLASWIGFGRLGTELIGVTEQNEFTVFVELPTGARLEASDRVVKKIEEILNQAPEVKSFTSRVEPWSSKIYVKLVPVTRRVRSAQEVIESLRPQVERVREAFIYFEESQEIGTRELILDLFGYDYDKLRELAMEVANRLQQMQGLTDVKIRMREGRPEVNLPIDKERAAHFGLQTADVADTVHAEMRGLRATVFHAEGREVETIGRLDERFRKTFQDVKHLAVVGEQGEPLMLQQVAGLKFGLGPSEVWRKNKMRMVQVSANLGRVPLGTMAKRVQTQLAELKLPQEYSWGIGGDYDTLIQNQREMLFAIALTLLLIYLLLASLFESISLPIVIMMSVPVAMIGVTPSLMMMRQPVTMGVLLGLMWLGGIVVSNGIILVDRITMLRQGSPFAGAQDRVRMLRAALTAGRDRLRPILMTSATTVLGLIPAAIDRSEGANLWAPLAVTVITGLTMSTLCTLFVVPAMYLILEDVRLLLRRETNSRIIAFLYSWNAERPSSPS